MEDQFPIQNVNNVQVIIEEENEIKRLNEDINEQINFNNALINDLENNSQSLKLISFSIITNVFLFFIGIIYPLTLLPYNNSIKINYSFKNFISNLYSLKGILLTLISIVFIIINLIFFVINFRLKYEDKDIYYLKKYNAIEKYSKYFKNMKKNT